MGDSGRMGPSMKTLFGYVMEWECCGHSWQLQMWEGQPERVDWAPVCDCGKRGKSYHEIAHSGGAGLCWNYKKYAASGHYSKSKWKKG